MRGGRFPRVDRRAIRCAMSTLRETDLYPPVKLFLEAQGFEVKAEIGAADVVARRGDEPP